MSKRPTFQFRFRSPEDATAFKDLILRKSDKEVKVQKPFTGRGAATLEEKTVLVTGTGSLIMDMALKEQCVEECTRLRGCLVG